MTNDRNVSVTNISQQKMTEMFQWPKILSKKWPKCFSDQNFSAKNGPKCFSDKFLSKKWSKIASAKKKRAVAANTLNLCEFEQCASVDTKKCWCFHCLYATTL